MGTRYLYWILTGSSFAVRMKKGIVDSSACAREETEKHGGRYPCSKPRRYRREKWEFYLFYQTLSDKFIICCRTHRGTPILERV
jgi:hypothetical protein